MKRTSVWEVWVKNYKFKLHHDNQHHYSSNHNIRPETLIAVADSKIAQAAANGTCHGRLTHQADNQPAERHALDIIQAAKKNPHIQIKILDEPADNRLIGPEGLKPKSYNTYCTDFSAKRKQKKTVISKKK